MARSRRSRRNDPPGFELLDALFSLPWWVRFLMGIVSFAALRLIAAVLQSNPFLVGIAALMHGLSTVVLAVFGIAGLIGLAQAFVQSRQGDPLAWKPPRASASGPTFAPTGPPIPTVPELPPTEPDAVPAASPRWSLELLRSIEWKRFEELSAAYYRETGMTAKTIRRGADGGVDVTLYEPGAAEPAGLVQCKAWNVYTVGVKPVRELLGVMTAQKVPRGIFLTTGQFGAEARDFARGNALELIDGPQFLERIRALHEDAQQRLVKVATEGDYQTPTCPSCGIKMIQRKGREGQPFWGCQNFPRGCKQTFQISAKSRGGSWPRG